MGYHIDIYEAKKMLFEDYMLDYTFEEAESYYGYPCSSLSFECPEEEGTFCGKTHSTESLEEYKDWFEENEVEVVEREYFNGEEFESVEALTSKYGVDASVYKSRMLRGWSQEEALGIVLRVDEDNALKDAFFKIEDMYAGIKSIWENNPYCVLGISAKLTKSQVLDARDKLEKYKRIGALESYFSSYDLPNVEVPNRDLGRIQVILAKSGDMRERWLWFADDKYVKFWNAKLIERARFGEFEYDELLACYFQLLIADALFKNRARWIKYLTLLDSWLKKDDSELYKQITMHLNDEDAGKYNFRAIVNSFRTGILYPLEENVQSGNGQYLVSAISFWKAEKKFSFSEQMYELCKEQAMIWTNRSIAPVIDEIKYIPDHNHPTTTQIETIVGVTRLYLDDKYRTVLALADSLEGEYIYSEMIREKVRKNLWDAGYIIWKGGNEKEGARAFSGAYMFCDDKHKRQIKNTFSLELLVEIPESEFDRYDSKRIADKHEHNKDYALALKWYKIAADKGSEDAKYKVGKYYEKGTGVTADLDVAYRWYIDAAEDGSVDARRKLAPEYCRGTVHCRKDRERAKSYWISYLIEYPYEWNTKQLNRHFPGWKKESDAAFGKLSYSRKHTVNELADLDIGAAAYYMGEHLSGRISFNSYLGYSKDEDEARRWYLKAVLLGYTSAESTLRIYYSIDVHEAYTANSMFLLGVKYSKDKSEKGKDLTFFWYYRAVENGYEDGCNNLGVCYDDGVGVEQNYEEANKLYLRAIKHNNNSGALYNYGVSLYYGHGVEEDEDKAKEYLIKARDRGNSAAKEFLKNKYGIADGINIDFEDIADMKIYSNSNVNVEFCGICTSEDGFELRFWISNSSSRQYNFWAKGVTQNDEELESFSKICECEAGESHFYKVSFDSQIVANDNIRFSVEIDDMGDEEICTTTKVEVKIGTKDNQVSAKLMGIMISPPLEENEEKDNEFAYAFAGEDFDDITIYNKNSVRIDFCGLFLDEDENVSMRFWVNNGTRAIRKIWILETIVDGDSDGDCEIVGTFQPNSKGYADFELTQVDVYDEYSVEVILEVDDNDNKALDDVGTLSVEVDFNDETISASIQKPVSTSTAATTPISATRDSLYTAGSYYKINSEHNGVEIYFSSKPSEAVRDELKANRWRWFQSKGCWYTFDSQRNRDLAERITGNNQRR